MPYHVIMDKGMHIVMNKKTGKVHGKHKTHAEAVKQMILLYMVEGGGTPRNK